MDAYDLEELGEGLEPGDADIFDDLDFKMLEEEEGDIPFLGDCLDGNLDDLLKPVEGEEDVLNILEDTEEYFIPFEMSAFLSAKKFIEDVPKIVIDGRPSFDCYICSRPFLDPKAVTEHVVTHCDHDNFICEDHCMQYTTLQSLKNHVLHHYIKYICSICGKDDANFYALVDHVNSHSNIESNRTWHTCKDCSKVFVRERDLNRHYSLFHQEDIPYVDKETDYTVENEAVPIEKFRRGTNTVAVDYSMIINGENTFPCYVCKTNFKSVYSVAHHVKTHFPEGKLECKSHGVTTNSDTATLRHIIKHYRVYKCNFCRKLIKSDISQHLKTHVKQDVTVQCGVCNEKFASNDKLKEHCEKIHGLSNPYNCELCTKYFYTEKNLSNHMSSVHKENIDCKICKKNFNTLKAYNRHVLLHGKKKFVCDICKDIFVTKEILRIHVYSHLKVETKSLCRLCLKVVPPYVSMEQHLQTHRRIFEYICHICGHRLGSRIRMIDHLKMHMDPSRLECQICYKKFKCKNTLMYHATFGKCESDLHKSGKRRAVELAAEFEKPRQDHQNQDKRKSRHTSKEGVSNKHKKKKILEKERNKNSEKVNKEEITKNSGEELDFTKMEGLIPIEYVSERSNVTVVDYAKNINGKNMYLCYLCPEKFTDTKNTFSHVLGHFKRNKFYCKLHKITTTVRNSFLKHVATHYRRYKCNLCERMLATANILKVHYKSHATYKNETCDVCGKKFFSIAEYRKHYSSEHDIDIKIPCDFCDKQFKNRIALAKHRDSCHLTILCKACGREIHKAYYHVHVKRHKYGKNFECGQCKMLFFTKKEMEAHALTHLKDSDGEKKLILRLRKVSQGHKKPTKPGGKDSKEYFETYTLGEKNKKDKNKIKEKLNCDTCKRRFKTKDELKIHITDHLHYKCEFCSKTFGRKRTIVMHVSAVHLDIRTYQCPFCPNNFHTKSNLKGHLLCHGNTDPLKCDVCGSKFMAQIHLDQHQCIQGP